MGLEISVQCLYLGDGEWRSTEVKRFSKVFLLISVRSRTGTHECLISGQVLFPARPITWKEREEGTETDRGGEGENEDLLEG